uniref:Peptidase C9 domain-containing protein n=1 Tax=Amphimedon queenslandica TaxID=400682 RepID=A0A1X7T6J9_AMPQE
MNEEFDDPALDTGLIRSDDNEWHPVSQKTGCCLAGAIVDSDYKFMLVDIGCNGRVSDGGVYCNTKISKAVKENHLNVPGPKPLPESDVSIPYTMVADDAFPLKPYNQKPYSHIGMIKERQIFNYCLSCACRRVKDTFGILSNRFRVFNTPIGLQPKKVETIILPCCYLHNFLRSFQACSVYISLGSFDTKDLYTHDVIPSEWRQETAQVLQSLTQQESNHHSNLAKIIQNQLTDNFNSKGAVCWQDSMI